MTQYKITKKDINRTHLYWWAGGENSNSYERLQALSFCSSLSKNLEKLYGDDKEGLVDALERNLEFFNTEGTIGALIPGMTLALEEKKATTKDIAGEMITNLKLGLMGPIAGIGDTLIWGTMKAILLALGASYGLIGSPIGLIFPFIYSILIFVIGRYTCRLGYSLGTEAVNKLIKSGLMSKIINAASVLGLFMMGALSASYVTLNTKLNFTMGATGSEIVLQDILDSILPGILPLCVIFGIAWYFKNKKQNYVLLISVIILVSLLGSFIGLF